MRMLKATHLKRRRPMSEQATTTKTEEAKAPALIAYHVPERSNAPWTKIGAAWDHKDGAGFTLQLDLIPAGGGRIVLRTYQPKDEAKESA
jgi:hypothetical protein